MDSQVSASVVSVPTSWRPRWGPAPVWPDCREKGDINEAGKGAVTETTRDHLLLLLNPSARYYFIQCGVKVADKELVRS